MQKDLLQSSDQRSIPHFFWVLTSFLIVCFAQPALIKELGFFASSFGFALFWKESLKWENQRIRFFLSFCWFSLIQAVQLSWLATPEYMSWLIIPFYLFLICSMGLQFALLSFFVGRLMSLSQMFMVASFWTLLEWSRLYFLCGFSWNPVGLSLASSSYGAQMASILGVFGLSFWVILTNLSLLRAWMQPAKSKFFLFVFFAGLPYLFGFFFQEISPFFSNGEKTLNIAIVQTNFAPEEKEKDPTRLSSQIPPIAQWALFCKELKNLKKTDLMIFPEAAFPMGAHAAVYPLDRVMHFFDFTSLPPLKKPYALFYKDHWRVNNVFLLQALSNQLGSDLIVGLDDWDVSGHYNAAFHFAPTNAPYSRYEKQILAPVGEYLPLQDVKILSDFIRERFHIYGFFNRGKEGKIFSSHVPIAPSICLEETFSHLGCELKQKGAELFVHISNDAFFPNSRLAKQHFEHARIRAIENGVPILRSCNRGISGAINSFGNVLHLFPSLKEEEKVKVASFSFPVSSHPTLYQFWGNQMILGICLFFITSYLLLFRKKKLP